MTSNTRIEEMKKEIQRHEHCIAQLEKQIQSEFLKEVLLGHIDGSVNLTLHSSGQQFIFNNMKLPDFAALNLTGETTPDKTGEQK